MNICLVYNEPTLEPSHPDAACEAGVLESVTAMAAALRRGHHLTWSLAIRDSLVPLVESINTRRPQIVVNLCEGFGGHSAGEGIVPTVLESLGVAYTGATAECLHLVRDKPRTKWLLSGAGLATPPFCLVRRGEATADRGSHLLALGSLIVKPATEDASLGIEPASVVTTESELHARIAIVHERFGDALVEQYIAGREFNVGITAMPELLVLPIAELEFAGHLRWPIVTYAGKWFPESVDYRGTPVRCPADIDCDLADELQRIALAAYQVTGCRDYARVDLRVDPSGRPFVLEVNANPDAGPNAGLARMLCVAGVSYDDFVARLVETAVGRSVARCVPEPHQAIPQSGKLSAGDARTSIRSLEAADQSALLDIVRLCGNFRPDEIEIAAEVLAEAATIGAAGHYQVFVAEYEGQLVGWSCHGLIPLTDGAYDLYWIAVTPEFQGRGVGQQLLGAAEQSMIAARGRWLLAETSALESYRATCRFYERCGFVVSQQLDDFYRRGDGRITYAKRLDPRQIAHDDACRRDGWTAPRHDIPSATG